MLAAVAAKGNTHAEFFAIWSVSGSLSSQARRVLYSDAGSPRSLSGVPRHASTLIGFGSTFCGHT